MRNFDLRNVYFDADGNRFYGKIFFTEKDTSGGQDMPNLKPIYEADGETQLANPIYSTIEGVTSQQVFLDNGAYSVWLYKYVGNGDMSTDTDEEHWEKVNFTPFNVEDPIEGIALAISSKALLQVANIEELRETGAAQIPLTSDGKRLVMLMGYEFAGDKRPVVYSLVSSSDTDNGGSVISSADSGYKWILIDNGESYVDVADFGVFADLQEDTNVSQISKAIAYANNSKKAVHFNKGQYRFNGGNYNVYNDIILDGSTFSFKSGTTTNIDCLHLNTSSRQIFYGDGTINFKADDIRLGWKNSNATNINLTARKNFYVDANYTFNVSDVDVWLILAPHSAGGTFTRCVIHGEGKLDASGTYTFVGGRFTDKYYSSPFAFSISRVNLTNCTLDINDFSRVVNWFDAGYKQGLRSFDFQGKGFEAAKTIYGNLNIYNAEFNYSLTCGTDATFKNCQFSNFACNGNYDVIFDNCNLSISSNVYTQNLTLRNCVVNDSNYGIIGRESTSLNGCHIGCKIGWEDGQEPYGVDAMNAHDTQFTKEVRVAYNEFYSCDFLQPLYVYSTRMDGTEYTSCRIIDCIFRESAYQFYLNGTNTPCNCVWKNNQFCLWENNQFFCYNAANAITFSYAPKSDECYYEYEGNTGSCPKEKGTLVLNATPTYEKKSGGEFTSAKYLISLAEQTLSSIFYLGSVRIRTRISIWSYFQNSTLSADSYNFTFIKDKEVMAYNGKGSMTATASVDEELLSTETKNGTFMFNPVVIDYEVLK